MKKNLSGYGLEQESWGFWFWKKKWAIYRYFSYAHGETLCEGKGLIGRYKTITDATEAFERLRSKKK